MYEFEEPLREYVEQRIGIDPAHDISHVKRVVAKAKEFGREERNVDFRILVAAAWLHDVNDDRSLIDMRAPSSVRSAEIAVQFLRRERLLDESELSHVQHAISAHSYTSGIEPETIEAKLLSDADRIDALGAIGIARCFVIGGRLGAKLYCEHSPLSIAREPNDRQFILDHFYQRLLALEATFFTSAGKREAVLRTAYMRDFIDQLSTEIA